MEKPAKSQRNPSKSQKMGDFDNFIKTEDFFDKIWNN